MEHLGFWILISVLVIIDYHIHLKGGKSILHKHETKEELEDLLKKTQEKLDKM